MEDGIPLLLEIDPSLNLDELRTQLNFEIVAERESGFVIVASGDMTLQRLREVIADFAEEERGSGVVASVYAVVGAGFRERLGESSGWLIERWPTIRDDEEFIVDVGVECAGDSDVPPEPKTLKPRGHDESDATWARRESAYQAKVDQWKRDRVATFEKWDALKDERQRALGRIVSGYGGKTLDVSDEMGTGTAGDFTVRVRVSGQGLKDIVENYPYVFEVLEPDDIDLPQHEGEAGEAVEDELELEAPDADAPAVGIVDSGIQEGHRWLSPAIDSGSSISFVHNDLSVADQVTPGGHGTRVAGAALYGETVPRTGKHRLPCWLQNARVLDAANGIPKESAPALLTRAAILRLRGTPKRTRVFNHSINAKAPCRTTHMSAWATEIDQLSFEHDVLVVQSAGNISKPALAAELNSSPAGSHPYPAYLNDANYRVANPAHSLQALTVGSVAYAAFDNTRWRSFATAPHEPSAFTRCGLAIWGVIKPEVVEFGGDFLHGRGTPPLSVGTPATARSSYPELVRSTLGGGPSIDRDAVGTSYSAPKVTHVVAHLQALLPDESTLLYRALVVQSARWPDWAEAILPAYRAEKAKNQAERTRRSARRKRAEKSGATPPAWCLEDVDDSTEREHERAALSVIRRIGFGVPSLERATLNHDYRTTLISIGEQRLTPGSCQIFEVPVPPAMRAPGNDYDVRVDVTLSYAARPRRTRRTTKRYLGTWLDWISSKRGESLERFRVRALKDVDGEGGAGTGRASSSDGIPWNLGAQEGHGSVRGVSRGNGTIQKDWAILKLHQLPESFCIAVRGHRGWSRDPDEYALYAVAVSFEVVGEEVAIYEQVRAEVERVQAEVEIES